MFLSTVSAVEAVISWSLPVSTNYPVSLHFFFSPFFCHHYQQWQIDLISLSLQLPLKTQRGCWTTRAVSLSLFLEIAYWTRPFGLVYKLDAVLLFTGKLDLALPFAIGCVCVVLCFYICGVQRLLGDHNDGPHKVNHLNEFQPLKVPTKVETPALVCVFIITLSVLSAWHHDPAPVSFSLRLLAWYPENEWDFSCRRPTEDWEEQLCVCTSLKLSNEKSVSIFSPLNVLLLTSVSFLSCYFSFF